MGEYSMIPISDFENKVIKSIHSTAYKKCYQCIHYDKIDNLSPIHAIITFMDRTTLQLCSAHLNLFKQKRIQS